MDRRELFGRLGSAGAGLVLALGGGPAEAQAHDGERQGSAGPMAGPHAHFCGIHVAKKDPKFQLIVQHYCAAHRGEGEGKGHEDEMFQCILFDSRESNAKLLGVEYIISDARYRRLPEEEKRYWHPHTYEVLGGGLIAPGMEPAAEREFMEMILTTWGKTWHTWPDPKTDVPIGEPLLIWSLTADGQADAAVLAERDRQFGVSTERIRRRRVEEFGLEVPNVAFPRSMDQIGRQWTDQGEDRPTRRRS